MSSIKVNESNGGLILSTGNKICMMKVAITFPNCQNFYLTRNRVCDIKFRTKS